MIRVLIAADSAVVRAGLEALLASSPGIESAGAYPDLSHVEDLHPAVVLAAIEVEALSAPANDYAPAYVLLTGADQPAWTQEAVGLGVRALLPRDASAEAILAAVESAAEGLAVIDPRELEGLLSGARPIPVEDRTSVLTPRELEVLRMMADGSANKQIAWKLGISEHTVKFHVAAILSKMNAGTRTEAVTNGIRRGLILM